MGRKSTWLAVGIAAIAGLVIAAFLSRVEGPVDPGKPAYPTRIICMAPNIAETVFALGAGDRVAGVSDFTVYPPEAKAKPSVGALTDANLERIASLRPDLIIVQQRHEKVETLARKLGIRVLSVRMEGSVRGILQAIQTLGGELGCADRAKALCAQIETEIAAVRKRVKGRPRPKVLACVDRSPGGLKGIYCAGGKGFLDEMVRIAGGEDVLSDEASDYVGVSAEEIVRRAPEVIIETLPGRKLSDAERGKIADEWSALETVPAVKTKRIYILTDDFIVVPGPRMAKVAGRIAGVLHPEAQDAR